MSWLDLNFAPAYENISRTEFYSVGALLTKLGNQLFPILDGLWEYFNYYMLCVEVNNGPA